MIIVTGLGLLLVLIGLWGVLTRKNLFKIIISFSIIDTGTHVLLVSIGYLKNKTAPIIDKSASDTAAMVDPLPSALVLTAIVIGVAVLALMLAYAVKLYNKRGSVLIDDFKELKW
jgi:multisubunit Na+/H+ antiporter MnhC subunit